MTLLLLLALLACGDRDDKGGHDGGHDGGTGDGGGGTDGGGTGDGGTGDGGTDGGGSGDGGTGDGGSGDGGSGDGGTGDGGSGDGGTGDGGSGDGGTTDCLSWSVYPLDADGAACTECPGTISFLAEVANACTTAQTITTRTTCLVSSWSLISSSGTAEGWGMMCGDAITDWTIPPGGSVTELSDYGRIRPGSYEVEVRFDDMDEHRASARFSVR